MTELEIPSGIRGLSDRRRLPRHGKVRLGIQVPNKRGNGTHPEAVDYFVTDDDENGRRLRELLGTDEPRSIPIAFPVDDPAQFARHHLELWGGGGRKCYGDGEQAVAVVDVEAYERWASSGVARAALAPDLWASSRVFEDSEDPPQQRRIPCFGAGYEDAPACPMYGPSGCGPSMHLQFVIRGFPGLGVWQLDTGSAMSIERVLSFVDLLRAATGGHVAWIPLTLSLEPMKVRGRTFYILHLDAEQHLEELRALEGSAASSLLALPPASDEEAADSEIAKPDDRGDRDVGDVALDRDDRGDRGDDGDDVERAPGGHLVDEALRQGAVLVDGAAEPGDVLAELGAALHPLLDDLGGPEPMEALWNRLADASGEGDERASFALECVARSDSGRVVLRLGNREEPEIRELAAALRQLRHDWFAAAEGGALDLAPDDLPEPAGVVR